MSRKNFYFLPDNNHGFHIEWKSVINITTLRDINPVIATNTIAGGCIVIAQINTAIIIKNITTLEVAPNFCANVIIVYVLGRCKL